MRNSIFMAGLGAFSFGCSSAESLGERTIEVSLAHEDSTNHGPEDATGLAVIETVAGEISIEVAGLPPLEEDVYEGWLAGGDEDPISTGRFQTEADGTGGSLITLGDLRERTYERVVITVEPEPDTDPGPDPRHSIGGDIPAS